MGRASHGTFIPTARAERRSSVTRSPAEARIVGRHEVRIEPDHRNGQRRNEGEPRNRGNFSWHWHHLTVHGVGRGPELDARCFYEMQRSKNAKTRTEKDSRVFDGSSRDPDSRVRFPLALPEIACICKLFLMLPATRLPFGCRTASEPAAASRSRRSIASRCASGMRCA